MQGEVILKNAEKVDGCELTLLEVLYHNSSRHDIIS